MSFLHQKRVPASEFSSDTADFWIRLADVAPVAATKSCVNLLGFSDEQMCLAAIKHNAVIRSASLFQLIQLMVSNTSLNGIVATDQSGRPAGTVCHANTTLSGHLRIELAKIDTPDNTTGINHSDPSPLPDSFDVGLAIESGLQQRIYGKCVLENDTTFLDVDRWCHRVLMEDRKFTKKILTAGNLPDQLCLSYRVITYEAEVIFLQHQLVVARRDFAGKPRLLTGNISESIDAPDTKPSSFSLKALAIAFDLTCDSTELISISNPALTADLFTQLASLDPSSRLQLDVATEVHQCTICDQLMPPANAFKVTLVDSQVTRHRLLQYLADRNRFDGDGCDEETQHSWSYTLQRIHQFGFHLCLSVEASERIVFAITEIIEPRQREDT